MKTVVAFADPEKARVFRDRFPHHDLINWGPVLHVVVHHTPAEQGWIYALAVSLNGSPSSEVEAPVAELVRETESVGGYASEVTPPEAPASAPDPAVVYEKWAGKCGVCDGDILNGKCGCASLKTPVSEP